MENDGIRIHHHKDGTVGIATVGGGWFPGNYDSEETARFALKENVDFRPYFFEMQARVNHFDRENRGITMENLESLNL